MAHSFLFKRFFLKYRKVVIGYVASSDGCYHRITFKDCTLSEALCAFDAMAKFFSVGFMFVKLVLNINF